jgi:hypothetical protein
MSYLVPFGVDDLVMPFDLVLVGAMKQERPAVNALTPKDQWNNPDQFDPVRWERVLNDVNSLRLVDMEYPETTNDWIYPMERAAWNISTCNPNSYTCVVSFCGVGRLGGKVPPNFFLVDADCMSTPIQQENIIDTVAYIAKNRPKYPTRPMELYDFANLLADATWKVRRRLLLSFLRSYYIEVDDSHDDDVRYIIQSEIARGKLSRTPEIDAFMRGELPWFVKGGVGCVSRAVRDAVSNAMKSYVERRDVD